jgi:hypothetical protein
VQTNTSVSGAPVTCAGGVVQKNHVYRYMTTATALDVVSNASVAVIQTARARGDFSQYELVPHGDFRQSEDRCYVFQDLP